MNDHWNDPPEEWEAPECCGEEIQILESGTCACPKCGRRIEPTPDIEPMEQPKVELCQHGKDAMFCDLCWTESKPEKCPHGNEWGFCDPCDYLSDIAYDAAREQRKGRNE